MPFSWLDGNPVRLSRTKPTLSHTGFAQPVNLTDATRLPSLSRNSLIELQGLDPYYACLHQGSERHAALASDLVEEFRAPIVDSLVLYLINRRMMNIELDFEPYGGGIYLSESGRKKYLRAFLQRMEERIQTDAGEQPRWDLLNQQVRAYKLFVYDPGRVYKPYLIR